MMIFINHQLSESLFMEYMINSELVKILRNEKTWSQDHLASVSGLSLRTIQRIEKEGKCSLDSKRALASVFEINANELDPVGHLTKNGSVDGNKRYGYLGAGVGLLCSYSAITYSLIDGSISSGAAGLCYGSVGAAVGLTCWLIDYLSKRSNQPVMR